MKTESLTSRVTETTIKIQTSKVNAVRIKDISKRGQRVYRAGKIGISGTIGDVAPEKLLQNAIANLNAAIDYPYPLSGPLVDRRNYGSDPLTSEDVLALSESILAILRQEYSDFSFSEGISFSQISEQMNNSEGLDLEHKDAFLSIGLVLKEKKSANLFDGFLGFAGRRYEETKFWDFTHRLLAAYRKPVALPVGDTLPLFFIDNDVLLSFLSKSLNGERYATGSSLFSEKIGEQIFNPRLSLEQNRNPKYFTGPFFDREGVVLTEDRFPLIEGGILKNVRTDKKTAHQYNLPHSGSAAGSYDAKPGLDQGRVETNPLRFLTDSPDIHKALKGGPAVLALVASGGEFTPDGSFATPIQVSFLTDGKELLGKLPEFSVRSHLYKMLGKDYIGTFDNDLFYLSDIPNQLQGYYLTIVR